MNVWGSFSHLVDLEGTSNAGFKWFMLQARDIEKNVPIGSFLTIDPNTQNHDCYNLLVCLYSFCLSV